MGDRPKIELYGHPMDENYLWASLEHRKTIREFVRTKMKEENPDRGEKVWDSWPISISHECPLCGRNLYFDWSGEDNEAPVIATQFERPEKGKEKNRAMEVPVSEPCPTEMHTPTTVRFTCKSGRIAVGNDFRKHFPDRREEDAGFSVNSEAGKNSYIRWSASHGYITGFVGNTHIWFTRRSGGLDVTYPGRDGGRLSDEDWDRFDQESDHDTSTELWWFAIVDAADLPEGATDSYDREIGFIDLPPGEYEVVVASSYSEEPLVATLRRVSD